MSLNQNSNSLNKNIVGKFGENLEQNLINLIIGITGPSGSGKSEAISLIIQDLKSRDTELFNIFCIDADDVAHQLLKSNLRLKKRLMKNFSSKILLNNKFNNNLDGNNLKINNFEIDRKKLGEIVFSDKKKLKKLNKIIFGYIKKEILNIIKKNKKKYRIILIDAPTLIESKLYKICDKVVLVIAERENRLCRIMQRDKLSKKQADNRLSSQLTDSKYKDKADFIIYNNKDLIYLKNQMNFIINNLIN